MANWQRTLRLWPEWDQASEGEIAIQELAAVVAKRLRALRDSPEPHAHLNDERDDIADEFDALAGDKSIDAEDFDGLMHSLYGWADTQIGGKFFDAKKVCWIDQWEQKP